MGGMLALATGAADWTDARAVALLAVAWLAFFAATWLKRRL
jgi:hypothetical protein